MKHRIVVLFLCLYCISSVPLATASNDYSVEFDQKNGLVYTNATIELSGISNLEMRHSNWKLWDVSVQDSMTLVMSGDFLSSVQPVSEQNWAWTLNVTVHDLHCTCYMIISVPENKDMVQASLLMYIGEQSHRPEIMLPHSLESAITSQNRILLSTNDAVISLKGYVPYGELNNATLVADVCESPYWVCLQERVEIPLGFEANGDVISVLLNTEQLGLKDGIWDFEMRLIDETLVSSSPIHIQVHIDTQLPIIELEFDNYQTEHTPFTIYASVNDGYKGSDEILTWTLQLPNGSIRALSNDELIENTQLELNLSTPGEYIIEVLVRDSAGNFNRTNQTFIVNDSPIFPIIFIDALQVDSNKSSMKLSRYSDWNLSSLEFDYDVSKIYWMISFPNGTTLEIESLELDIEHFPVDGEYFVTLMVQDEEQSSFSTSLEIEIYSSSASSINAAISPLFLGVIMTGIVFCGLIIFLVQNKRKQSTILKLPKWDDEKNN